MANLTLLDVARLNAGDDVVGLIEESLKAHPELSMGSGRTISGTGFDSLVRTTLPSVGFRNVGEGVATTPDWRRSTAQASSEAMAAAPGGRSAMTILTLPAVS